MWPPPWRASNDALVARIAGDGLLVSEVPPGAAPRRGRLLVRNRVIAALTRGTVVVEAAVRSGALSTAHEAERLRRPVMDVPGPVTSIVSQGVHRTLRRGAILVTSGRRSPRSWGRSGPTWHPSSRGRSRRALRSTR